MSRELVRTLLCASLVLLGVLVLAGWAFDIEVLKSVMPGLSTMKVNTALAFILVGTGIFLAGKDGFFAILSARFCGAFVFGIGFATLVEYAAATSFGIDELFFPDRGTLSGSGFPGRMSPLTAMAWAALGSAIILLTLCRRKRVVILAHVLVGYGGFAAFFAAAGYAFGAEAFSSLGFYTAIAIHTALGLMMAAAAALMTRADAWWLQDFDKAPNAWAMFGRALPMAMFIPLGLGLILMLGVGLDAYNAAFAFSLYAPLIAVTLVWWTVLTARQLRDSEIELRQHREQLAGLISQATAGFGQVDLDGNFNLVNDRFCEIAGRSREELMGVSLFAITHPDDLERNRALFDRAVRHGTPYTHEKRYVHPDGSVIWVNNSVSIIKNAKGDPFGVLAVSVDVTERRRAEEALSKSAERVRLAVEGAGMATWEMDAISGTGEWSPNRFDILGYARTPDLKGSAEDWLSRVHPEDTDLARDALEACRRDGTPFDIEYRILRADTGEERWLLSHGTRIDGKDLAAARLLGVSFDITERKRAEAALAESEWRFRTIFEQANDYIFTADLDQRVTSCNPAVCAALGYTQEEALGRSFAHFVGADGFQQTTAMLQKKLLEGGSTRHTIGVKTRDGRELIWEINSRLMLDPNGKPTALHAIGRDVTEARRLEEHQRLLIDELNHRVKNTLAIVQAMAHQTFRDSAGHRGGNEVFQGRLSALSTAHDILTRDKWSPTPLAQIIADVVAPHSETGDRVRLDGEEVTILPKTAITLALAIHELCTNAVKYGALSVPSGTVHVAWRIEPDQKGKRLKLSWIEKGGPDVSQPVKKGFGTRMIERGLAAELGGNVKISFLAEGLRCDVDAPLPEVN